MNKEQYKTSSTYIDITSDPGFKIIFGREAYKDVLISFLNAVITRGESDPIVDITYLDKEKVKENDGERSLRFDIHCQTSCGRRFIVEMQRAQQNYFIKRSVFYASRAVTEQGKPGSYHFGYAPVYTICIMNFTDPDLGDDAVVDSVIWNMNTRKPLTDAMRWTYIQLPNFNIENPEDCVTEIDKWVYVIKNMKIMERMPFNLSKAFRRLEEVSRLENLSDEERARYESELKYYRDYENTIAFARTEGLEKGIKEGMKEGMKEGIKEGIGQGMSIIIRNMLSAGRSIKEISETIMIPLDQVQRLSGI